MPTWVGRIHQSPYPTSPRIRGPTMASSSFSGFDDVGVVEEEAGLAFLEHFGYATCAMYLIALLVVFILGIVFAIQNNGHQDFTFLGYTWSLRTWIPTAIGTGIMAALLMLHMSYAGLGYRLRRFGQDRSLDEQRGMVVELREENTELREELAAATGAPVGRRRWRQSWMDRVRSLPNRVTARSRSTDN
jgi:uncharacterized integral membrane protein